MSAIELKGLSKRFGARAVFAGFDLEVQTAETVALLGPSGCGKSTLLRILAGLATADEGSVRVEGEIGLVFQEPRLFPWLTVRRNVEFGARNATERDRAGDLLRLVGLAGTEALLPKQLSGGMAQRVALARTLIRRPAVLLLDEPLAALDAIRRAELQGELRAIIAAQALTTVIVTHDIDEAIAVASRVIVLGGESGEVRADLRAATREQIYDALVARPATGVAVRTYGDAGKIRTLRSLETNA